MTIQVLNATVNLPIYLSGGKSFRASFIEMFGLEKCVHRSQNINTCGLYIFFCQFFLYLNFFSFFLLFQLHVTTSLSMIYIFQNQYWSFLVFNFFSIFQSIIQYIPLIRIQGGKL